MRAVLGWMALAAVVSGCTAVKATYHVSTADQAVNEARRYGARENATYEYTMAVRYLDESKERLGFDEYRVCEQLARKSLEWADKALISIEEGKRVEGAVEVKNEDLPVQLVIPPDNWVPPAPEPIQFDQYGIPIAAPAPPPAPPPPPPEPEPVPQPEFEFGSDE